MYELALALLFSQGKDSPAMASSLPGLSAVSLGSSVSLAFFHRGQWACEKYISPKFRLWCLGLCWRLWRCSWGDGGPEPSFLHMEGRAHCVPCLKETGWLWGTSSLRATSRRKSWELNIWPWPGNVHLQPNCGRPTISWAASKSVWEMGFCLSALVKCHLECCIQLWGGLTGCGSGGVSPGEGCEYDQWAGGPLLWRQAEMIRVVQPEEVKAPGTPYGTFQ